MVTSSPILPYKSLTKLTPLHARCAALLAVCAIVSLIADGPSLFFTVWYCLAGLAYPGAWGDNIWPLVIVLSLSLFFIWWAIACWRCRRRIMSGLAPDAAMVLLCTWLLEIGVYLSALLVCAWDTELGSFYLFIPYFSLPLLAGNGYMLFLLRRLDA